MSEALRDVTGFSKTYLAQFAEHPEHQHVHVHVIARTEDLDPNHRGPFVFAELGADENHRVAEPAMNELVERLRGHRSLVGYGKSTPS